MTRIALCALAAAALAACSPAAPTKAPPAAKPKHRAPAQLVAGPLPAPPAWARRFMGKIIDQMLPEKEVCVGNADRSLSRFTGSPAGSGVGGWAWDRQAKQPVARVLLTDETLRVWGAGEGGEERPDVPRHLPEASGRSGWQGAVTGTSGLVVAWGLVDDGRAICPLGELDLGETP